jgi:hypothetical protein
MTREKSELRRAAARKSGPQADAAGQYGDIAASPNPGGVASANPVVLSGDGDATSGSGHGRDRDGTRAQNRKSRNSEGQSVDDLPFAGTPSQGKAKRAP